MEDWEIELWSGENGEEWVGGWEDGGKKVREFERGEEWGGGLGGNVSKVFVRLGAWEGLVGLSMAPFTGRLPRGGGSLEGAAPSEGVQPKTTVLNDSSKAQT